MDKQLAEAADKGDVDKLHNLIKDYPLLLRAVALASGDTPLHIACIGGHVNFVKEVLNLRPEFALELNKDGFSSLHVASANGDVDIVKELLKVGSHLCLVKGRENRVSLHFAVVKGRREVIRELLSACLDSITEVTARGETCFHLAVKNNQFEALKVLCQHVIMFDKEDVLDKMDKQGNTVLHLATSRKQYQVVDLLLDKNFGYKGKLDVNPLNKKGLTPLDVLMLSGGDCEIEEILTLAGAVSRQNFVVATQDPSDNQLGHDERRDYPKTPYEKLQEFFKYERIKDSPSEARNTLLVMAVLIATATYTAMLSPPGGVWQDDFSPDSSSKLQPPHTAGEAVMATHAPLSYGVFLIFNSLGLFTSLQMMFLLTLGLPLQIELKVAVVALSATYFSCLAAITRTGMFLAFVFVLTLILMTILTLAAVVRDRKRGRGTAL